MHKFRHTSCAYTSGSSMRTVDINGVACVDVPAVVCLDVPAVAELAAYIAIN